MIDIGRVVPRYHALGIGQLQPDIMLVHHKQGCLQEVSPASSVADRTKQIAERVRSVIEQLAPLPSHCIAQGILHSYNRNVVDLEPSFGTTSCPVVERGGT